jgi:hypothetical protein
MLELSVSSSEVEHQIEIIRTLLDCARSDSTTSFVISSEVEKDKAMSKNRTSTF